MRFVIFSCVKRSCLKVMRIECNSQLGRLGERPLCIKKSGRFVIAKVYYYVVTPEPFGLPLIIISSHRAP